MLISKKLFKASRPYLFTPMNFLSLENRKPISFNLSYPIALAYSSIRKSRLFESLIVFMLLFLFVLFVENEFILIFFLIFFFCCPTGSADTPTRVPIFLLQINLLLNELFSTPQIFEKCRIFESRPFLPILAN